MTTPTPRGTNDLNAWLSWQELAHPKKWDLGLERIMRVWRNLGQPKIADKVISIAGTNGKGSCVAWGEAMAKTHQLSYASFTSPHLLDYCERIRFQSKNIAPQALCRSFDLIDEARDDVSLTYFEWSALAAFHLMSERDLDIAFLEVGLGGRLDAVNIIDADAVVFTEIGLDHQDWLGDTIDQIAQEKSGILRNHQLVALADKHPPKILLDRIAHHQTQLFRYGDNINVIQKDEQFKLLLENQQFQLNYPALMPGEHQLGHCAAVASIMNEWFDLQENKLNQTMTIVNNFGRLTYLSKSPDILIDVAHNPDSAKVLKTYLQSITPKKRIFAVCGMLKDKDQVSVLSIMKSVIDHWFFTGLGGDRGSSADVLIHSAKQAGISNQQMNICDSVADAYADAKSNTQDDLIVIIGSFVTVTEFLKIWENRK